MEANDPEALELLLVQLKQIVNSASSAQLWAKPPIIDSSYDENGDLVETQENDTPGLRQFKMSVSKEIEGIENFLSSPTRGDTATFATNAPYFTAVWSELLTAPRPILAVEKYFPLPPPSCTDDVVSAPRARNKKNIASRIKVDIVAGERGRTWIRVNTTKLSRLLIEFRTIEAFNYVSDEEDEGKQTNQPSIAPELYLDNSVMQTGKGLLAATRLSAGEDGTTPTVVLRLSRLSQQDLDSDLRVSNTFIQLQKLGINIELGLQAINLDPPPPLRSFRLPQKINLDLSMLIALVSDITHAPLPSSREDAEARFQPQTDRSWKKRLERSGEKEGVGAEDEGIYPGAGGGPMEHCRELAVQGCQEMDHSLLEETGKRIQSESGSTKCEFWTTQDAKTRFFSIIDKIGGEVEKRRAKGLFGEGPSGIESFWWESRYPSPTFHGLPVKVFATDLPPTQAAHELSSFNDQISYTCRNMLQQPRRMGIKSSNTTHKQRTVVAPVRFAGRLSAHTIVSLLWGAETGMVTLTSNKASVKALLREMRGFGLPLAGGSPSQTGNEEDQVLDIAVWVTGPRSLAEGMRADSCAGGGTDLLHRSAS